MIQEQNIRKTIQEDSLSTAHNVLILLIFQLHMTFNILLVSDVQHSG